MSRVKNEYFDDINPEPEAPYNHAEEEHNFYERKRREKLANVPVAAPVTVRPREDFKFTTPLKANPATDGERFAEAKTEADKLAAVNGYPFIVFKSEGGFYFTRELKYSDPQIVILYNTAEVAK